MGRDDICLYSLAGFSGIVFAGTAVAALSGFISLASAGWAILGFAVLAMACCVVCFATRLPRPMLSILACCGLAIAITAVLLLVVNCQSVGVAIHKAIGGGLISRFF